MFKDFGAWSYVNGVMAPDPAVTYVRGGSELNSGAVSGAWTRSNIAFVPDRDASYLAVGARINSPQQVTPGSEHQQSQYFTKWQLESRPFVPSTPPTPRAYSPAREIQVVVKPDRLNLARNSSFETPLFSGTPQVLETNWCTNPSFEIDTSGWLATDGGTTISRDTTEAAVGSASLKVVTNGSVTQQGCYYSPVTQPTMDAGVVFGTQVKVKGPAGTLLEIYAISQGSGNVDVIQNVTLTGGWDTFSVTGATLGASKNPYVIVRTRTPQARTFYVDAVFIFQEYGAPTYFDGNTAASGDFTYLWDTAANASVSRRKAPVVDVGGFGGRIRTSSWAENGTYSLRHYSKYHLINSSYIDLDSMVDWNKTYTLSATVRIDAGESITQPPGLSFFVLGNGSSNPTTSSLAPSTSPGVYRLSLTFTVPENLGGSKYLRLYNNNTYGKSVWWDSVLIEAGTTVGTYFDGASGDDYIWETGGAVQNSRSYFYENRLDRGEALIRALRDVVPIGIGVGAPQFGVFTD